MVQNLSDNNLDVVKESGTRYDPVFRDILEDIPGGGTLVAGEMPSDLIVLGAGVLLVATPDTDGLYNLVKSQKSTSTQASSTSITLKRDAKFKGLFKAGEFIAKYGAATVSTITSVTRTANTTDTIVTGTAIGALATASIIVRLAAAATVVAATATGQYTALGMTRDNIRVREDDLKTLNNVNVGIIVRGTVNEQMLPYKVTATQKTNLTSRMRFA